MQGPHRLNKEVIFESLASDCLMPITYKRKNN
jgi:hypothetical protein